MQPLGFAMKPPSRLPLPRRSMTVLPSWPKPTRRVRPGMPTPRATRAAAERAAAELAARQAAQPAEPPPVTAEEWLAAHEAEAKAEDPYRKISEDHDLAEVADQRTTDQREGSHDKALALSPEPDIREETAEEGTVQKTSARDRAADEVRVPTADETAESVRRAQRALQEVKQRRAAEARHTEDEAREEASRWHADQETRATDHEARGGLANHKVGPRSLRARCI